MRIAVLGGGAAGMGAAWGLAKNGHAVTLIEREPQLGGHLMACAVPTADGGTVNVDVGVSDFNRNTFTNVGALFDELGLEYYPINQHASFMHPDGRTAWYTNDDGVNPVTPFDDQERFTEELARFTLECIEVLDDPAARDETLHEYCDRRGYSQEFRTRYLYPRAQGSFPMPDQDPATYPVRGLVAFWHIHGLAGPRLANRYVLKGGMASYGEAFAKWLESHGGIVITEAPVIGVARRSQGVRVRWETGETAGGSREETFDHCVFAVRGEQVLPLLEDPRREESEVFGSLRWHRVRVAVHRDATLMPDRREAWGAYNYVLNEGGVPEIRPTITFYPAKLAALQGVDDVFVTMNPFRDPDPELTIANYFLSHPAAGRGGDMAAARIAQIQGIDNCWYCGSYLVQPWVHEPALATGVDLAELMRQRIGKADERQEFLDDFLARIPLFAGMDPFASADVRLSADRFALEAGERLFAQGAEADGVYLVSSGTLSVSVRTPGDGILRLADVGPGEIIGEFALLDGGRRSAEVRAVEPVIGYRLDLERFRALRASERPAAFEVLARLRREVAVRTLETLDRFGRASGGSVPVEQVARTEAQARDCEALLSSFPGFDRFSAQHWHEFAGLADRMEARRGRGLEGGGSPPGAVYIVARGALSAGIGEGETRQLIIHGPGSVVGAAALATGGDWPLALTVREDAVLFAIPAREFQRLVQSHTPLALRLLDLVGEQMTGDLRALARVRNRIGQSAASRESV